MSNGAIVTTREKYQSLASFLEARRGNISKVVPKGFTAEKMCRLALNATIRTPSLLDCTPESIYRCVLESSQLGLDCSGLLGSGYMVPFNNKRTGKKEAQFIPGYRGLIDLARRSGQILDIDAHVVYEGDAFECEYGLERKLKHTPSWTGDRTDAKIIAVYAIAFLLGDQKHVEVMTRKEVDAIRARSKSGSDGPWVTDYAEMARKTVVKRLLKYCPISVEVQDALAFDSRDEVVLDVDYTTEQEHPQEAATPAPETKAAEMAQRLKASRKKSQSEAAPAPAPEPAPDPEPEPEPEPTPPPSVAPMEEAAREFHAAGQVTEQPFPALDAAKQAAMDALRAISMPDPERVVAKMVNKFLEDQGGVDVLDLTKSQRMSLVGYIDKWTANWKKQAKG